MKTEIISTSKLGILTIKALKELGSVLIVEDKVETRLAVVLPYEQYLEMQNLILKANQKIEELEQKFESWSPGLLERLNNA